MSNIHLFFAGVPSDGPTPTAFTSLFASSPGGNVTPGVRHPSLPPKMSDREISAGFWGAIKEETGHWMETAKSL